MVVAGKNGATAFLGSLTDRGSARSLGRDAADMGRQTGRDLCWAVVWGSSLPRLLPGLLRHLV